MIDFMVPVVFLLTVVSIFVNQDIIDSRYLSFLDVPYYISPILGAALIYIIGGISPWEVYQAIFGVPMSQGLSFLNTSGPFSTIVLFISVVFISLLLEVTGFFKYVAVKILKRVNGSGIMLFAAVFWVTAFFALFTSNDIIILTFTPFLLEFLNMIELDALPFLVAEFFAANIFSMVMLIGNETNIIAATAHSIGFIQHLKYMFIPGFAGGLAAFIVLYTIFRKDICTEYSTKNLPEVYLDRWEILSTSLLVATLFSLGALSMYGVLLWHIGLFWALMAFTLLILPNLAGFRSEKEPYLYRINDKMPWEVVPFLLGFFIIIEGFSVVGLTSAFSDLIYRSIGGGKFSTIFGVGTAATLSANLLNNIPMTLFFSDMLSSYGSGSIQLAAVFSLIIGSNIGANITPIGALAGIMWIKMVNYDETRINFKTFFLYGIKVTSVTAAASFAALYLLITL